VYRHLSEHPSGSSVSRRSIVLTATKEVAQPVLFGILIIILVFLPILSLQGMEGKMFKPLAYTIMIALLVSLLLSLTLSPALCSMALTRGTEEDPWLLRKAKQAYAPSLSWALTHRRIVLSAAVAMLGASLALFPFLGGEFIPILNEAAITPQTIRLPSISLEKSIEIEMEMQRAVMEFPEVRMVVSKIGRSELGNDPQEPNASDPVVSLKPMEEWKTAKTKPELDDAIRRRIERVPGANFLLSQPIQQRVDELLSGVRSEATVKIIGEDLDQLRKTAEQVQTIMTGIVGVKDGTIVAIEPMDSDLTAPQVIELADDEALLPGVVDSHVHVNDPGRTEWEGFASATKAAAAGGVTTLVDMPLNSIPPTVDVAALEVKRKTAKSQAHIDVGFWGGALPDNVKDLRPLHDAGVFGFKAFLSPSGVDESF